MVIHPELLEKATDLNGKLLEAEKQALLARAEYHTAVRRMHLAGASLREIAEALGVSHQRVSQIVDDAGGSWWQRIWRTRKPNRDAVCSFCERPPSELGQLIAGPDVYICDACITAATHAIASGARKGALAPAKPGAKTSCSFCGKRRTDDRPLAVGPKSQVCGECLAQCRQIITERAPWPPK